MVTTQPIYLMVSQTDTRVARMIRAISRYPYNHVSISPELDFHTWYSYARYVQDAPFYSGFICEPAERFLDRTGDAHVRIYRVDIPVHSHQKLMNLLGQASNPGSGLIYNYFDAIASTMKLRFPIPGSHTCLSFACHILDRHHVNIPSLCRELEPHLIYEGSLAALTSDSGNRADPYFGQLGFLHASLLSLLQVVRLTKRAVFHGFNSYMANRFHRTVQ